MTTSKFIGLLIDNKIDYQLDIEKENGNSAKFIDIAESFDLYPPGCNDSHIETAMKSALKELGI